MPQKIKFIMENILLSEALPGHTYIIKKINIENEGLLQQLSCIGFCVGQRIIFVRSNFGKKTFLVKVMSVNFGIDRQISEKVEVADA